VADRSRVPNLVLRRMREEERQETRGEFAESMARKAREIGEPVAPSERYVARLEDGDVRYPYPSYRRVLTELCGRSMAQLGFTRKAQEGAGLLSPRMPQDMASELVGRSGPHPGQLAAGQEWPMWFGMKIAALLALIENWNGPVAEIGSLQALLNEEILMFDATVPDREDPGYAAHVLARRQALVTLAALPAALVTANQLLSSETRSFDAGRDFFLSRCAASITACWHLLRGSDLATVDHMLAAILFPLEGIARQRSRHQQSAAALASQAHRISGIVALHRDKLRVRERHCKQALYYATIASDMNSRVSALISLASTYFYMSDPAQAALVYEQVFALEASVPPLQRSRVYAEISVVYGQAGRLQEAIRSAELAEELYPDDPEHDPSFLYAEFTPASLTLERGLAYVALAEQYPARGYQRTAADIFARTGHDGARPTPDRIRFEIVTNQARTAVLLDDMDAFEVYLSLGLEGAALLGSNQRHREAALAWERAAGRWPQERRIRALSEQLQLTAGGYATESPGVE
jgi:tetratricopeptide (TPR) repeat protein